MWAALDAVGLPSGQPKQHPILDPDHQVPSTGSQRSVGTIWELLGLVTRELFLSPES